MIRKLIQMPKQRSQHIQEKITRLKIWIRWLTLLYRILTVLGLALLILAILLLALTTRFSPWILLVPGLLVGLGVLLAWIEYRLHKRRHGLGDLHKQEEYEGQ